jgi:hypothetical protein
MPRVATEPPRDWASQRTSVGAVVRASSGPSTSSHAPMARKIKEVRVIKLCAQHSDAELALDSWSAVGGPRHDDAILDGVEPQVTVTTNRAHDVQVPPTAARNQ